MRKRGKPAEAGVFFGVRLNHVTLVTPEGPGTGPLTKSALFAGLLAIVMGLQAQQVQKTVYVLGPGDVIHVRVSHSPEISERPVRLDDAGYVTLPLLGRFQAAGLTSAELTARLQESLRPYFKSPAVGVELVEVKSHPVSILGAVKLPGVYQIQGQRRLLDLISMAGGIEQDAGNTLRITRHRSKEAFPLPAAKVQFSGDVQVGEISVSDLMEARHPEENIALTPEDTITIPRAKLIYIVGEVRKAGGFPLRERERMSVLQAISLAEGLLATAAAGRARIIRTNTETNQRTETAVDVKAILAGKASDQPLQAGDVLFVPNSRSKQALMRGIDSAILMGTGVVIWRR